MTKTVGIEGIGVAFPPTYVSLAALATARGVAPEKYTEGLGVTRMAVPLLDEDTVTLAAKAGRRALEANRVDASSIGMLVVGTETAVDHSKPVASFVQGLLEIPSRCRVFETKHACYGGTAALQLAADWVRSGSARGQKALVICSDIARYGLRTPGEPTQGAGAVALIVSDTPTILSLDSGRYGVFSQDVMDFWRPLYSKDAFVDGHYSVTCYLDALAGAYAAYRESADDATAGHYSDRFAAIAYHVPYGKMARKAHRHLRAQDADTDPDASFARMVAPSLVFPSLVGNCYAASLYLALTSLLATTERDLAGKPVGLFSYGSGCCAEFFSGTVLPGAQGRVRALDLPAELEARRELTVPEYEAILTERERQDERPVASTDAPAAGADQGSGFRFAGTREHRRTYLR